MTTEIFHLRILAWFDRHGRQDLPWQRAPTPYRVWVSEIMLQQTQVTTVIPYFKRFMQDFPGLPKLAASGLDDVLHHWSGLGYYARARNLHKAARLMVSEHGGLFPDNFEAINALPGIGRSTAGAILSLAYGERQPILDGNVKRVLTRFDALDGWPGQARVLRHLWQLAEAYTPTLRIADYTQAMMDLGATVCTRSKPRCTACPLRSDCRALAQGRVTALPTPRPRKTLPVRRTRMLLLRTTRGEVLLEQRPPLGLWGGLWCLPEAPEGEDLQHWVKCRYGLEIRHCLEKPELRHTFSHFHLDITPLYIDVLNDGRALMEAGRTVWYNSQQPKRCGLAAPVQRLLESHHNELQQGEGHEPPGELRKTG